MSQNNQGKAPAAALVRALGENVFVEENLGYMNEGDKDSFNVIKLGVQVNVKAYSDDPASAGAGSAQDNVENYPLVKLESYVPFNPADFHSYFPEYQPGGLFQWETLSPEIQNGFSDDMLGETGSQTEDYLTNGGSGVTGLIPQLNDVSLTNLDGAEPTTQQVVDSSAIGLAIGSNSPDYADLDVTNIFDKMDLMVERMPYLLRRRVRRGRAGIKWMVGSTTMGLINSASRKLSDKGVDITEAGIMRYAGFEIVENPSFPNNCILLAEQSGNIRSCAYQLGTSSSADFNNLYVAKQPGVKRLWDMLLTWAIEIVLVRPEEVAWYTSEDLTPPEN